MKFASWGPLWAEIGLEGGGEDLDSFEGWRGVGARLEGLHSTAY